MKLYKSECKTINEKRQTDRQEGREEENEGGRKERKEDGQVLVDIKGILQPGISGVNEAQREKVK